MTYAFFISSYVWVYSNITIIGGKTGRLENGSTWVKITMWVDTGWVGWVERPRGIVFEFYK